MSAAWLAKCNVGILKWKAIHSRTVKSHVIFFMPNIWAMANKIPCPPYGYIWVCYIGKSQLTSCRLSSMGSLNMVTASSPLLLSLASSDDDAESFLLLLLWFSTLLSAESRSPSNTRFRASGPPISTCWQHKCIMTIIIIINNLINDSKCSVHSLA